MKPLFKKVHHHLTVVRSAATQRVIRSFANDHGLVYFGSVDQHHDEHELVGGVTLSKDHRDRHYSVGNLNGYDVILLQRTDTLRYPHRPPKHYTWVIMQFDLHVAEGTFGHVFIDGHHHDDMFFSTLSVKFNQLRRVEASGFAGHEPAFVNGYKVMCAPRALPQIPYILRPDITAAIAKHFPHLDFEIDDDRILIYASNVVTTRHSLDYMVRAGMWLTDCLETVASDRTFPR